MKTIYVQYITNNTDEQKTTNLSFQTFRIEDNKQIDR